MDIDVKVTDCGRNGWGVAVTGTHSRIVRGLAWEQQTISMRKRGGGYNS